MFAVKPMPNEEACAFIADKPVVSRQVFDTMGPEFRAKAFVITGVEDFDAAQAIKDRISQIPAGADYEKTVEAVTADLLPWLGNQAERRAELLVRWHGFQAYASVQHQTIQEQADIFPHCMYVSSEDSRVRPSHAALDRLVLPSDSKFWDSHTPPWEPLCRCDKIPMTHGDVDEIREADANLPPLRKRVLEGPLLLSVEQTNEVHGETSMIGEHEVFLRGPETAHINGSPRSLGLQVKGNFGWNPNDVNLTPVQLLGRWDNDMADTFVAWAQKTQIDGAGTSAWDWMNGKKADSSAPPGWKDDAQTFASAGRKQIRNAKWTGEEKMREGDDYSWKLTNGVVVVYKRRDREKIPDVWGIDKGTMWRREKAASIVDEALGINLVPPTEVIMHRGKKGSAQVLVPGRTADEIFKESEEDYHAAMRAVPQAVKHDMQLLDDLLQSADRHGGNILLRPRKNGPTDVAFIDNGCCLAHSERQHNGSKAYRWTDLDGTPLSDRSKERLAKLLEDEQRIRLRLQPFLEKDAVDLMFARARRMLESGNYLDSAYDPYPS